MRAFTARRTAVLLTLLVGYYVWVVGSRAVVLLRDDRLPFRGMGVGLLLLAGVGVLLVAGELRFGAATQRLAREVGDDVGDVEDFDAVAAAAAAAPGDWRGWYRLALAYDAGRDPRRGRQAMRRAIRMAAADRGAAPGAGDGPPAP